MLLVSWSPKESTQQWRDAFDGPPRRNLTLARVKRGHNMLGRASNDGVEQAEKLQGKRV
jgi:hypothetical protein